MYNFPQRKKRRIHFKYQEIILIKMRILFAVKDKHLTVFLILFI